MKERKDQLQYNYPPKGGIGEAMKVVHEKHSSGIFFQNIQGGKGIKYRPVKNRDGLPI